MGKQCVREGFLGSCWNFPSLCCITSKSHHFISSLCWLQIEGRMLRAEAIPSAHSLVANHPGTPMGPPLLSHSINIYIYINAVSVSVSETWFSLKVQMPTKKWISKSPTCTSRLDRHKQVVRAGMQAITAMPCAWCPIPSTSRRSPRPCTKKEKRSPFYLNKPWVAWKWLAVESNHGFTKEQKRCYG